MVDKEEFREERGKEKANIVERQIGNLAKEGQQELKARPASFAANGPQKSRERRGSDAMSKTYQLSDCCCHLVLDIRVGRGIRRRALCLTNGVRRGSCC
jgi:hypothetical protein